MIDKEPSKLRNTGISSLVEAKVFNENNLKQEILRHKMKFKYLEKI
jgi:hypothetical protein